MFFKKDNRYNLAKISLLYTVFMILCFWTVYSYAADHTTKFDGGIIIPDRSDETLYIMGGGTYEMSKYNDCWKGTAL